MRRLLCGIIAALAFCGAGVSAYAEKVASPISGWEASFWQYPAGASLTEGGTVVEASADENWVQSGLGVLHIRCEKSMSNLNAQAVQNVAALEEGKQYRLTGKIYISSSSWGFGLYMGDTRLEMLRNLVEKEKWCELDYTFTFEHKSRELKLQVAQAGELYADDLSLTEVGSERELLVNGGFEADFAKPADVSLLTAETASGSVTLGWSLPSDENRDKVCVFTDGAETAELAPTARGYTADGLENGRSYTFTVKTKTRKGIYSDGVSITAVPQRQLTKPTVIKDDKRNVIVGLTDEMEYSTDGSVWTRADTAAPPVFDGDVTVYVRYIAEEGVYAPQQVLHFTENSGTDGDIVIDGAVLSGNSYLLRGRLAEAAAARVTMVIIRKDADRRDFGAILAIAQTTSGADGSFEIGTKLADTRDGRASDGRYTVYVDSDITGEICAPELVFVNSEGRQKALGALFGGDVYALLARDSEYYDAYLAMGFPLGDYSGATDESAVAAAFAARLAGKDASIGEPAAVKLFCEELAARRIGTLDADGVYAFLQQYDGIIGLKNDEISWAELAQNEPKTAAAVCVYMAGRDCADFEAVVKSFSKGYALAKINAATYGVIGDLINKYASTLGISGEYYDKYKALKSGTDSRVAADKSIVTAKSKSPFSSENELARAIENAVKALGGSTAGGGSSSGGGSSGGGGGSSSGSSVNFTSEIRSGTGEMFGDMQSAPWARTAVEQLGRRGIISGDENGCFAPERNVSRAEFAAMLTRAFRLTPVTDGAAFSDVGAGSWYYDAVILAARAGIVCGGDDGRFMPEEKITRQDLAAMLARCVDFGSADTEGFADMDEVSGYARDAVLKMKAGGIISGYADGSFCPMRNASRAEAALILYNVLNSDAGKERAE